MTSEIQTNTATKGHWPDVARQWKQVGPPLRPSPQDIGFLHGALNAQGADTQLRALILGVTPELYQLLAPVAHDLIAMDHTQAMIECVWPGARDSVILSDWRKMPLADASQDVVVCDGGLHLLSFPDGQRELVTALRRVVAQGGLCLLRLFIPPPEHESVESVLQDLLDGTVPSL
ncbi:MAG: class I SAM-dependent methyltransferase, partial [bacterium]